MAPKPVRFERFIHYIPPALPEVTYLKVFARGKMTEGVNRFGLVIVKTKQGIQVASFQSTAIPQPKPEVPDTVYRYRIKSSLFLIIPPEEDILKYLQEWFIERKQWQK